MQKTPIKKDYILQKRPVNSRSLLIVANPYQYHELGPLTLAVKYVGSLVSKNKNLTVGLNYLQSVAHAQCVFLARYGAWALCYHVEERDIFFD